MDNPNETSQGKLTLVTSVIVASVVLTWSVGLIGKGCWQLWQQSSTSTRETMKNIPDFAGVPHVATGVFNYGGSTAWASLRLAVDSVIQSERPELKLRYIQPQNEPPGSRPGIQMLLDGQLAFVQSSRALNPEEYRAAKEKGLQLKQVPVAIDSIAVAVHSELDLPGLTLSQLQAIYQGKITNWRELGGKNIPINVYSRPPSTGDMVDIFRKKVLQNQQFGRNVKFIPTTTQALRQLAKDHGGIYYDSTAAMIAQCTIKLLPLGQKQDDLIAPYQKPLVLPFECPQKRNQSNFKALRTARYPLTHYLYVIFLENSREQEDKSQIGRAYANFLLTPQGQKLIAKTGFIPID